MSSAKLSKLKIILQSNYNYVYLHREIKEEISCIAGLASCFSGHWFLLADTALAFSL